MTKKLFTTMIKKKWTCGDSSVQTVGFRPALSNTHKAI